jgi:hypothetical protein
MADCLTELGEYWPQFAHYTPIPRTWRNILSDPKRLFRPTSSCSSHNQLVSRQCKSYLEILDSEFPDLFLDLLTRWLSRMGFIYIFRLARSCKRYAFALTAV